jgi:23S rRNA (cytidine1920-2'-O)/16S rRNA (cytidine1409-2'-O)-methyltransferase
MDVSFISATLVLPAVVEASGASEMVVLVKPQFEVGRERVGKGGIVRDGEAQREAVRKVSAALIDLGFNVAEPVDSPILGAEGNREFLLHATRSEPAMRS